MGISGPESHGASDLATWEGPVDEIRKLRDTYKRRAEVHKYWYWATGVLVILMSATLPLLAGLEYDGKDEIIAALGVAIAALTGLRSFFHWDQNWSLLRQADFDLSYLLRGWEMAKAVALRKPESARAAALDEATRAFLEGAENIRRAESSTFFARLAWPKEGSG